MRAPALRLLSTLPVLFGLTACESPTAPTPELRAREILARHTNESEALAAWRRDAGNWELGLAHEIAWKDPTAPAEVRTERALVTPSARAAGCAAGDLEVDYRTEVLTPPGDVLASFRWNSLDRATAGHRRVRAAAAAALGDPAGLWARIETDPALEAACTAFEGRRAPCPAPAG